MEHYSLYQARRIEGLTSKLATLTRKDGDMRRALEDPSRPVSHQKRTYIFIVRRDGEIVGWAFLFTAGDRPPKGELWWHKTYFFVHPDFRRKGIGTELMTAIIPWAYRQGKRIAVVQSWENRLFFEQFKPHLLVNHPGA